MWINWFESNRKCSYFLLCHLVALVLDFFLFVNKAKLSRQKKNGSEDGFKEPFIYFLIITKFCLLSIAMKIQHLDLVLFNLYVVRDIFLFIMLYILLWSYLEVVPPTISETFINAYKGVVFGCVVPFTNLCVGLDRLFVLEADNTILRSNMRDLFFHCFLDFGFICLIFCFDTNTREEKVKEINSKNFWHMFFLLIYMIIKVVANSEYLSIHMLPQFIPFLYFNYMNYELNAFFNNFLRDATKRKLIVEKKLLYDARLYENVICLSYELLFLCSFMSYMPKFGL